MSILRICVCFFGLAFLLSRCALTQDGIIAKNGPPITAKEKLKQYNIATTKDALVDALSNPNAEVRGLAASQLAGERYRDAIPAMVRAVGVEKIPQTRINIAFALASLGEKQGFTILEDSCGYSSLPGGLRTRAASYLLEMSHEACLSTVMDIVDSSESTDRVQALQLLPRFKQVSKNDAERIYTLTQIGLRDSIPSVRLAASNAMVTLGNQSAVSDLQAAIADEHDNVVRSQMEADLRRLQSEKTSHE